MNFKSLALASVLAVGSIFGGMSPAEARPSSCWANDPAAGQYETLSHFPCDVTRWVGERSGTIFWNIEGLGDIVLYTNGTAKFYAEDQNDYVWFDWKYDDQGDVRLYGKNGFVFSFRR